MRPRRFWVVLGLLCAAGAGSARAVRAQPASNEVQIGDSTRLQFYGFLRLDVIYDDSRPDGAQAPLFILSEPARAGNRGNFTLHPRLTRFGANFVGPAVAGARLGGKLEGDFQNGGRESRQIARVRHGYMTVSWPTVSVLAGQTWDIISPLFPSVNNDTLMWGAGNLGDRRPQLRVTWQPKSDRAQWTVAGGPGLTGAIDQQDFDNDGIRDGEAAAVPNLQGRVGWSYPIGKRRASVGVWGHVARETVTTPIAGETDFTSRSAGLDYELPVGARGIVRGELWSGRNLSDFRGGIAQAINRTSGKEIGSRGGWTEAGADLWPHYSVFVGYTRDSPEFADIPNGGRTLNDAWFVVNRFPVGKPLLVGVDYLRWKTEYKAAPRGTDNRVNGYVVFNF